MAPGYFEGRRRKRGTKEKEEEREGGETRGFSNWAIRPIG